MPTGRLPAGDRSTHRVVGRAGARAKARRCGGAGSIARGAGRVNARTDGDSAKDIATWVSDLDQIKLDAACPRNGEVLAITNDVARTVRASGNYRNAMDFGNKVHIQIAKIVDAQKDPDLKAELLLDPAGEKVNPKSPGNVRLDLLERVVDTQTVCIYDYKTGDADVSMARAQHLATAALRTYPGLRRIILIQVRPQP